MTENDIYIIAKAWIEKDHESNAVDWVALMAADLYRRIDFHTQQKAEAQQQETLISDLLALKDKLYSDAMDLDNEDNHLSFGKANGFSDAALLIEELINKQPESLLTDKVEEALINAKTALEYCRNNGLSVLFCDETIHKIDLVLNNHFNK